MALEMIDRLGLFNHGNRLDHSKAVATRISSKTDLPCRTAEFSNAQVGRANVYLNATSALHICVYNHTGRAPSTLLVRAQDPRTSCQIKSSRCCSVDEIHLLFSRSFGPYCAAGGFSHSNGRRCNFRCWSYRGDGSVDRVSRNHKKNSFQTKTGIYSPHPDFLGIQNYVQLWPYKSRGIRCKWRLQNLCFLGSSRGECSGLQRRRTPAFHVAFRIPSRLRRGRAIRPQSASSAWPKRIGKRKESFARHVIRHCVPQARDSPPKRDTGIASEKDWGIDLKNELTSESGVNPDGSPWYRESGEDVGDNGYRCRWTVMGGKNGEESSEWREVWWEKSDWTGYKELGAEKSGKNAQGDRWWETWQEVLRQDDWSNLARIEKSAQKQAKSGSGTAGWYEKWWEKYNAKGWSEKGAHKYGRLNDQGWWEKWGEQYDGRGAVLKWTDKWAETDMGTKWGDKWEEKFNQGAGTRQGETWHYSANGERWSRTWGEEHLGNGKVHKYGRSTSGESWDSIVEEGTFYQAEPHYGWAAAVGNSVQLLAIETSERPPGIYPDLDLGIPSQ